MKCEVCDLSGGHYQIFIMSVLAQSRPDYHGHAGLSSVGSRLSSR